MSNVVPVHKKDEKSETRNYRPVSLLPALRRVLETVVASRMTEHLEGHHMLCTRQFGFQQGRSAADLHLLLTSELIATLDQGKATVVVTLKIEGTFDRVWQVALITKLHAAGINGSLITNYLKGRHLKMTVSGRKSEVQPIRAGVPQGSCLGPLLWNIYINDLLHLMPGAKAYADDITITQNYDPEEDAATASQLNHSLRRIIAWGNVWQVKFAPQKTQLLNAFRSSEVLSLNLKGTALTPQEEMEVLGVTYDRRLIFKTHIERLASPLQSSGAIFPGVRVPCVVFIMTVLMKNIHKIID